MQVHGIGLLILGAAGSGKSALALDLLTRGHRLVADDAVELVTQKKQLIGHCPRRLRGLMEVRGLGILDARRLFGARSLLQRTRVRLVLKLRPEPVEPDRLRGNYRTMRIAGVPLPCLSLSTSLGHNLAVYAETACLNLRR
ncbi:MAG: hypothetical protein AABY95_06760 [Pseudomonadota bacterium]